MKKRRGLTLLEVIISIAILGIITLVFLNIFSSGNKNIYNTEKKTRTLHDIQEQVDLKINKIENNSSYENEPLPKFKNGVTIIVKDNEIVKINGILANELSVNGKLITGSKDGIEINTFVPDKSEDE